LEVAEGHPRPPLGVARGHPHWLGVAKPTGSHPFSIFFPFLIFFF
jgi:hypothetical protein